MHKKLNKYIESYDEVKECLKYELLSDGGMIVLMNQEVSCEVVIDNKSFLLKSFQSLLINAYEYSVYIKADENMSLIAIRFKGAGASFFYEEHMDELMYNPNEAIFIEENISAFELDKYFNNRFKPSKLPFNIMKIIDLLDEQGSDYNIDEVLSIANVPRKILDKLFRLKVGLTFKNYAMTKHRVEKVNN